MKKLWFTAAAVAVALTMSMPKSSAQNLLAHAGFEDPASITADGAPFVGLWEAFNGGGASAVHSTVDPLDGTGHMDLTITGNDTFAGFFQDVDNLSAGQLINFSLWHKATELPYDLVSELRIEWRDSVGDTEIGRTDNQTTAPSDVYTLNSRIAAVPDGADTARVVYAIQSFTNAGADAGTVYVDNVSVTVVPEPSTVALVALSVMTLAGMRRRR